MPCTGDKNSAYINGNVGKTTVGVTKPSQNAPEKTTVAFGRAVKAQPVPQQSRASSVKTNSRKTAFENDMKVWSTLGKFIVSYWNVLGDVEALPDVTQLVYNLSMFFIGQQLNRNCLY